MVKKQNNNAWIVYVIALIAIVALILGAIALNKANMTGNAFWDFFKKQEQTQTTYTPETVGLLGNAYLEKGGSVDTLNNYQSIYGPNGDLLYEVVNGEVTQDNGYINSITYYDESVGGTVTVSQAGISDAAGGGTLTCTGTCGGNGCVQTGCAPSGTDCTLCSCTGDSCAGCVCTKSISVEIKDKDL